MRTSRGFARLAVALCAAAVAAGAALAQPKDPDWPCVQRKVVHLSIGMMWTGPLPEDPHAWRDDPELAALAARIAARRTGMEEVAALLAQVGPGPDAPRAERLATLFSGVFALIDAERARIVDGTTRYAQRQRALSERIDAAQAALAAAEAAAKPDDFDALDAIEAQRDTLAWDVRIYEERNRSLTYVCESPVILEKRAFAVARAVMAEIEGG
ncbi:MAG: hypothetical protein ACFCUS_01515 [Rubrimonas sp.]|uniref:hypothetical protein n=1 Tax=Rubrimonas sp. TaxID=2036015 RepID=UPI002FDDC7BE